MNFRIQILATLMMISARHRRSITSPININ